MTEVPPGGSLTDDELRVLSILLARFASYDLDQWELWRLSTAHGSVYLTMARQPESGVSEDTYATIWPLPTHLLPGDGSAESQQRGHAAPVTGGSALQEHQPEQHDPISDGTR
jgi:hypothetical protein